MIRKIAQKIKKKGVKRGYKKDNGLKKMTAEEWLSIALGMGKITSTGATTQTPTLFEQIMKKRNTDRKNTNNWRKMHGIPMKRKRRGKGRYERGKGTDTH